VFKWLKTKWPFDKRNLICPDFEYSIRNSNVRFSDPHSITTKRSVIKIKVTTITTVPKYPFSKLWNWPWPVLLWKYKWSTRVRFNKIDKYSVDSVTRNKMKEDPGAWRISSQMCFKHVYLQPLAFQMFGSSYKNRGDLNYGLVRCSGLENLSGMSSTEIHLLLTWITDKYYGKNTQFHSFNTKIDQIIIPYNTVSKISLNTN
jgi:hypothetical protein